MCLQPFRSHARQNLGATFCVFGSIHGAGLGLSNYCASSATQFKSLTNVVAPGWLRGMKHRTLDFGSGRDLTVMGSSHTSGCALSEEAAWDSPSLPPSPPHNRTVSLSLSK